MLNPSRRTSLFPFLLAVWLGAGFPSLVAQSWNEDSYPILDRVSVELSSR